MQKLKARKIYFFNSIQFNKFQITFLPIKSNINNLLCYRAVKVLSLESF